MFKFNLLRDSELLPSSSSSSSTSITVHPAADEDDVVVVVVVVPDEHVRRLVVYTFLLHFSNGSDSRNKRKCLSSFFFFFTFSIFFFLSSFLSILGCQAPLVSDRNKSFRRGSAPGPSQGSRIRPQRSLSPRLSGLKRLSGERERRRRRSYFMALHDETGQSCVGWGD